MFRKIKPYLLAPVIIGCAANPAAGQQSLVLMSEAEEAAIGRNNHVEILRQYGEYKDENLSRYVRNVGEKVAKSSQKPNLTYHFTVLDSPQVNAFALPGGYIYVTRGILAYLNSEAELAAVLGHEIGHVTARHAMRRHGATTLTNITGAILANRSGIQGADIIANMVGTAIVRGYGREHELEADRLGAQYIAQSGYDPEAMLDVIRVLKNQELFEKELAKLEGRKPRTYHGLFSTHPDNDKRLLEAIRSSKRISTGTQTQPAHDSYLQYIDGMLFGDGASQGVFRNGRFYHQAMDFTIKFPAGWQVNNQPDKVTAVAKNNVALLTLTAHQVDQRLTPEQFMRQHLKLKRWHSERPFQPGGLQGYSAIAHTDTEYGRRQSRIIVLYSGNNAFVLTGATRSSYHLPRYDDLYLQSGGSFRPLEANERQQADARRLAVKQYSGQRYSELAKNFGLGRLAESQIRLLNGHYPSGAPQHGDWFKTVE